MALELWVTPQMRQVPSVEDDSRASGAASQKSRKVTGPVCPSSTETW